MKEIPMKAYWMGQDIDDLPRETLIEIIHYMQKQLDSAREATDSIIRVNEAARMARARVWP
jgi:hypothetical protein